MSKAQINKPVLLVDGSSYLFRAFHALPPLITSKGQPTGAIKGVINMIRRLQADYPESKIVIIFDAKGKNFRHDLYDQYKANRPPMPDDLRSQIQPIHEIIKAMGLPLIIVPDVEADDVIGTLAAEASHKGIDTIISTGDKDMAQLVSPHVTLMNTMTNVYMDQAGVKEKFGVTPEQIIDYLALVGDTVDNIPGVPKCGPKTAVKWLTQHGTLDAVMESADEVKGKIGENLRNSLELLPLSYKLATIHTDVELDQDIDQIEHGLVDNNRLLELFKEYEFKGWINQLQKTDTTNTEADSKEEMPAPEAPAIDTHYETILTQSALDNWLTKLSKAALFGPQLLSRRFPLSLLLFLNQFI